MRPLLARLAIQSFDWTASRRWLAAAAIAVGRLFPLRGVAQICNLLYRRFVIGRASVGSKSLGYSAGPQDAILRYSRLQICATKDGICELRVCLLIVSAFLSTLLLGYCQSLSLTTLAGNAGEGNADGSGGSARFNSPGGAAVDSSGNVYVADTANHTIRMITSGGTVSTLAGLAGVSGSADGSGTNAEFNQPQGVAVDGNGNVYVADTGEHTVRE